MNDIEADSTQPTQPMPMNQDHITTPLPLATPAPTAWSEPTSRGASGLLKAAVALALVFGLASLVLSGFLIYSLLNTRQIAVEGVDAAIAAVDDFGGEGFHYDYRFERTIPVSASIPIVQDLVFPFKGNVPIKTTVKVPIEVLGQTFVVEVPIDTVFPVDVEVPIHVEQTFNISTTIPVSMDIPIDVKPGDPEIQRLLGNVKDWLVRLRDSFY